MAESPNSGNSNPYLLGPVLRAGKEALWRHSTGNVARSLLLATTQIQNHLLDGPGEFFQCKRLVLGLARRDHLAKRSQDSEGEDTVLGRNIDLSGSFPRSHECDHPAVELEISHPGFDLALEAGRSRLVHSVQEKHHSTAIVRQLAESLGNRLRPHHGPRYTFLIDHSYRTRRTSKSLPDPEHGPRPQRQRCLPYGAGLLRSRPLSPSSACSIAPAEARSAVSRI